MGSYEIVKNGSVLNTPEVKHFSDLSELNDLSEKCKSLTERAMKSSIHCATSIGEIKSLLKTDIKNILDVMDNMNSDLNLVSQDITILTAHMSKLNAVLYEVQDLIKDKLKSYDEIFQNFDKKLLEYGDIVKETNRKVSLDREHTPQPRILRNPPTTKPLNKPPAKKT